MNKDQPVTALVFFSQDTDGGSIKRIAKKRNDYPSNAYTLCVTRF